MRKNMLILLMAAVLLMSGCATKAHYQSKLDTWVGAPASDLLAAWGAPSGQLKNADGSTVYEWRRSRNVQMDGHTVALWCATQFLVGADGRVKRYSYEGNDCTSM